MDAGVNGSVRVTTHCSQIAALFFSRDAGNKSLQLQNISSCKYLSLFRSDERCAGRMTKRGQFCCLMMIRKQGWESLLRAQFRGSSTRCVSCEVHNGVFRVKSYLRSAAFNVTCSIKCCFISRVGSWGSRESHL